MGYYKSKSNLFINTDISFFFLLKSLPVCVGGKNGSEMTWNSQILVIADRIYSSSWIWDLICSTKCRESRDLIADGEETRTIPSPSNNFIVTSSRNNVWFLLISLMTCHFPSSCSHGNLSERDHVTFWIRSEYQACTEGHLGNYPSPKGRRKAHQATNIIISDIYTFDRIIWMYYAGKHHRPIHVCVLIH